MEASFYLGAVGTILEYFLMIHIIQSSWKVNKQLPKNHITEYKIVYLQLNYKKCFGKRPSLKFAKYNALKMTKNALFGTFDFYFFKKCMSEKILL